MPGIISQNDRKKFTNWCQNSKPDVSIDQWCSILVDRQFIAGRNGRYTKTNWARKNGRMICYSCLCVVPEEKSVLFL